MQRFNPPDPDFESRVRLGFNLQQLMASIDARMTIVTPGEVHIKIPFNPAWTQQHGYMHAGIITSIVDSACGFAAYTLMPASSGVLTVEYKVNFLSPARGEGFIGIGRVIKPGRTLTVCSGEVLALEKGEQKLIATMQATMMAVPT
ncbi:MAG TPA: PaaI family thioesterase [Blastocatellia bacterium]|nr:PaaI family thioesterase [Blastocatellia bacterium]